MFIKESNVSVMIDDLRVAVEKLNNANMTPNGKLAQIVDPMRSNIKNVDTLTLLERTERLSDGATSWRGNRLGYCQHATPIWDSHHLSHYTNGLHFSMIG